MFGYIKPDVKELKVKEHDFYKSIYCGLCRVMGKRYSYVYKMSLSYDFVFMVLLRLYIQPEKVSFTKKRCIAHPTKKKVMMDCNNALELSSDVGVIMLYHDFLDKINDKDGIKSFFCRLLLPELKRLRKKACKNALIAQFDNSAEQCLKALSDYEKGLTPSVDMPAEEFGKLLGNALCIGLTDDDKKIVFEIGKHLGKWIYIVDAVDDIEDDSKTGKYNPLLASFTNIDEAKKHGEMIQNSLMQELIQAYNSLLLIEKHDCHIFNILDNIIRIGNINTHEKSLIKSGFIQDETSNQGDL